MRGKSYLNVLAQKEILVSAFLDDIAEEIYRQCKTPPLNLHDEIKILCAAIEAKQAPHSVERTPELSLAMRDAATRVVSKLAIMALDL